MAIFASLARNFKEGLAGVKEKTQQAGQQAAGLFSKISQSLESARQPGVSETNRIDTELLNRAIERGQTREILNLPKYNYTPSPLPSLKSSPKPIPFKQPEIATISQAPSKTLTLGMEENNYKQPWKLDLSKYDTGKQVAQIPGLTKPYSADWWHRALEKAVNTPAEAVGFLHQSLVDLSDALIPLRQDIDTPAKEYTPSQRAAAMGKAGLATANLIPQWQAFTTALETAKETPMLSGVATAIQKGFEYLGKGGAYGAGRLIDILPLKESDKNELKPVAENIGGFITQFLLLHRLGKTAKQVGEVKISGKDIDLSWQDISDITIGKNVAPEKMSAYQKLTQEGIKFKIPKKGEKTTVKGRETTVADYVRQEANRIMGDIKRSGFGLTVEEVGKVKEPQEGLFSKLAKSQETAPTEGVVPKADVLPSRAPIVASKPSEVVGIPPELQPLVEEARRYKSAEEFTRKKLKEDFISQYESAQEMAKEMRSNGLRPALNADGTITIYHGTTTENAKSILESGRINEGSYFSPNKYGTKYYAKTKGKGGESIAIKIDPRGIEYGQSTDEIFASKGLIRGENGVWHSPERKSGQQFIDFYNQATKGIEKEVSKPLKPIQKPTISARELAQSKITRQKKLSTAMQGELGTEAQVTVESTRVMKQGIDRDVVSGIRNNPYFRKEKVIKDVMGEGWLMHRGNQTIVVESARVEEYLNKGFHKDIEIDQLAQQAGFERGEDFLNDQLKRAETRIGNERARVEEKLATLDADFAQANKMIAETKEALAGETVSKERFLTEQGKRELEQREMSARRFKLRAAQEYFGLSDAQMKKINRRDLRPMSTTEFDVYLQQVQIEAFKESELDQAKNELVDLIKRKELKKTENLQQAMKLPLIDRMTTEQLHQFAQALEPFQQGDEFLSVRKLETIDRTDFAGVKTWREATNKVREKTGLAPGETPDVDWLDKMRYDTMLAEKDPFYNYVVKRVVTAKLEEDAAIETLQTKIDELFGKTRKGIVNRIIPQDVKITEYLESPEKLKVAKTMTPAEIEAATFEDQKYREAYEYQKNNQGLQHSRFEGMYMPHIQRSFFEAVKDGGLKTAVQETLKMQKLDEQTLDIVDQKTAEVMPYEKWFKFAQKRTGGVVPTQNAAKSFMIYMRAFERKKALDKIIPEIMTAVDIISPRAETKTGIRMDDQLKTFITEYLNVRRGRPKNLIVKPGSRTDAVIHGLKAITQVIQLGLHIPLQIGSQGGVQVALGTLMGPKNYATGVSRLATKSGRDFVAQYENYTGRTPWKALFDKTKGLPEKMYNIMFGIFQDAAVRGFKIHLLGSLTPEEWAAGKITNERLAQLRLEAGRWLPIENSSSIVGSSIEAKAATQYRKWAIVIARTAIKNAVSLGKMAAKGNWKEAYNSREARELLRGTIITSLVALLAYAVGYESDRKKASKLSFINRIINKTLNDSFSLLSAFNPDTYSQGLPTISFVESIARGLKQLILLEKYTTSGEGYQKGELKGIKTLERTLTPSMIKQLKGEEEKKKSSSDAISFSLKKKKKSSKTKKKSYSF